MASRIDYSVSVSPVYLYTGGEGADVHSIASDCGKSFSGSASVASPTYKTTGTTTLSGSATIATTPASCKGIFIKNTGLDTYNATTTATVTVSVGGTDIAVVEAGGAFFLPSPVSSTAFTGAPSSGTVKVEYATFD